jgi:hypothetical protein
MVYKQIWQNLLRKAMAEKGLFSNDDDDDVRGHQKVVVMD